MFNRIRTILINPTHPGNIGAVARALKNMGLFNLTLVSPKEFPSKKAEMMASSAVDILNSATVVSTLEEALHDCTWALGFSGRLRKIPMPTLGQYGDRPLREAMTQVVENLKKDPKFQVGLVFGQEQSGLANEDLEKCHYQVMIPANPDYTALNLAQAVQLAAYEFRMAVVPTLTPSCEIGEGLPVSTLSGEMGEVTLPRREGTPSPALPIGEGEFISHQDLEGLYKHLEQILSEIGFLKPEQSPYLMTRLRHLFGRVGLDRIELNILRGILTAVKKRI